jgi:16S rRNA (guanine527-N7)-methyltransferase
MCAGPPERGRPLEPAAVGELLGVSRETLDRLATYLELLRRWQRTINLVGASTLEDPWRRHILDCGQLWRFWPEGARVGVDLGSGAGLPGLVLAILGAPEMHLVESDRRKAVFLREAARVTGAIVHVHACRIEAAPAIAADVVTARALAPLVELLPLAARFLNEDTVCLFLKGGQVEAELTTARRHWRMRVELHPSLSAPDGRVVLLREVHRA